jgi:peptidoglycan/xylan/chitin deacetylase (PgdA/CDA1 family)
MKIYLHYLKRAFKWFFHRFCFLSGITHISSFLTRKKLKILVYHRVDYHDNGSFLNSLRVTPKNFELQMRYLYENRYNIIPLCEAIEIIKYHMDIPQNSVVITFDDGYKDNYMNALPILRKYDFSATVFLTTQFVDSGSMWLDELDYMLSKTKLKSIDFYNKEFSLKSKREKYSFFCELRNFLKRLDSDMINLYMGYIFQELGVKNSSDCRRSLSWDEIKQMTEQGISFGAHCVHHICCSNLHTEDIEEEIIGSKNELDRNIKQNTKAFAYPYGEDGDFNNVIIQILQKYGFNCALAWGKDFNNNYADLFKLRRVAIRGDDSIIDFRNRVAGTGVDRICHKLHRIFQKTSQMTSIPLSLFRFHREDQANEVEEKTQLPSQLV